MAALAEDLKSEIISGIVDQTRNKLEGETAPAERFVRQYFDDLGADFLLEPTPDNLYGSALSIWSFMRKRLPGAPKIRVYNPTEEEHGWLSTHTVVEIVNDDMPFLVDSIVNAINRQQLTVHLLIHPVIRVARDEGGVLADVLAPGSTDGIAESILHVEVSQRSAPAALDAIRRDIETVLADVRHAVEDWQAMRGRVDELIRDLSESPSPLPEEEVAEGKAFLQWMRDDNFTLLGVRDYELAAEGGEHYLHIVPNSGLGVLREISEESVARHKAALPREAAAFARRKELFIITKANTYATVHRPVYMDYVGVRRFGPTGEVAGERRIIGLFTSTAYNRNPLDIPLLRHKIRQVLEQTGFAPGSHNAKAMLNILETYPRDELFQITPEELIETAQGVLHLEERQCIRLFVRRDRYARFFSCLVYIPRERYNTELRQRIEDILRAVFKGDDIDYTTYVSDAPMARVHFIVRAPRVGEQDIQVAQIEERLVAASRVWSDDLQDALIERMGEARGHDLFHRYQEAFSPGYQHAFAAQTAVSDIGRIEDVRAGAPIAMNLYHRVDAPTGVIHFKMYHGGEPVALSDILPMLENMGLKVVSEHPFTVRAGDEGETVYIHDFLMRGDGGEVDLAAIRDNFQEAFERVWHGEMEDDGLNRLVIGAGLGWRQVVILRAYIRYLRQARITHSQSYIEETLSAHPRLVRRLVEMFETRFDPDRQTDVEARLEALAAEVEEGIDGIANLDEDRILRRILNLVRATLRTNFYQAGPDGAAKPYLALKLASARITDLPLPRPWVEITVYSPRVEAIHLRGGPVARGGIRWSDRREDFRTEVLGLMKAQTVKNALIVPVGAKGGFVVKRPPPGGGREALMEEVVACYKTLIRGMLDLTDNRDGDRVTPPPRVVRLDGDDPYIVAAADKGTATFSDIANAVAKDYGYWLGDAFASGGSAGYDHKGMGITARGAWECVKRHFRELALDIQSEAFTVVGVGDMSGDVFGNGMLLSPYTKLVGAFNHLHIFIDPDPDPATGFAERRRLFDLPRSSWADYGESLISAGGGVFDRSLKAIALTPEIKALTGMEEDSVTPQALIRALLQTPVDLLWFGGIGTYVKASHETHLDVGDRASDGVRVDGRDLRARVVGEGANLGLTQLGRVEYALNGGAINTDAIDNSGGVDASDHEVNIKILLGGVTAAGDMTGKQRDALLGKMTDELAILVLRNSYQQGQAISVMEAQAGELLDSQWRLIRALERQGHLNRAIEGLPDDEELAERREQGQGLTRPELAVLLAFSKIALFDELVASDLPDDKLLFGELRRYFPAPLRKPYRKALERHPLRREIITTFVVNSMVNRVGAAFTHEMEAKAGVSGSDVARAYTIARDVFQMREIWAGIEALDNQVPAALQSNMLIDVSRVVERSTGWFLLNLPAPLDVATTVADYGPGIAALADRLDDVVTPDRADQLRTRAAELERRGVPKALAARIAGLDVLISACDLVRIATSTDHAIERVARVYFALGARFGLHWVRSMARRMKRDTEWEDMAIGAIVDDVFSHQLDLTLAVLDAAEGEDAADAAIEVWLGGRGQAAIQTEELIERLRSSEGLDIAMLSVASHQLRALAGR